VVESADEQDIVHYLQDLHDMLRNYKQPPVIKPSIASLKPQSKYSLSGLFGGGKKKHLLDIPDSLPKGLYMYGDVGSGKTMLMDLFYDSLPTNITARTRIHFHNFMQDVHRRMHTVKIAHGDEIDAIAYVAAEIAEGASVLCFDEFQCTDVADAMILRRLMEALMHHGSVIVTTSNRHPTELYKNGIQRQSFIPCIELLLDRLRIVNLDSPTDYRKVPRPPSGVYHHPLDAGATSHADKWFRYLGDFEHDPPHPAEHEVWGRKVVVPQASGQAARFDFWDLMGKATGAADYLELVKYYDAFIITGVPGMTYRERDLARRFITFIDSIYESRVSPSIPGQNVVI
jgi:protein AFG1